jgi:hypothetical protein
MASRREWRVSGAPARVDGRYLAFAAPAPQRQPLRGPGARADQPRVGLLLVIRVSRVAGSGTQDLLLGGSRASLVADSRLSPPREPGAGQFAEAPTVGPRAPLRMRSSSSSLDSALAEREDSAVADTASLSVIFSGAVGLMGLAVAALGQRQVAKTERSKLSAAHDEEQLKRREADARIFEP